MVFPHSIDELINVIVTTAAHVFRACSEPRVFEIWLLVISSFWRCKLIVSLYFDSTKPNSSCVGYSNLHLDLLHSKFVWTWPLVDSVLDLLFCLLKPEIFIEWLDYEPQRCSTIYECLNGWRQMKAVEARSKITQREDLFASTPTERPLIQELFTIR